MKRILIIALALVCAFALLSCKNEPEIHYEPPVMQVIKENRTEDISSSSDRKEYWKAGNSEAQYKLALEEGDTTAILKTRSYDHMTNSWPEEWVTYTGTYTMEKYDKDISETKSFKEITETWMYTVTFSSVDDPMYAPTVHVYDGMFDVRYIQAGSSYDEYVTSGWGWGWSTTNSGGYSARWHSGTVVAFEVTEHKDGAPSALIGVGNWKM